MNIQKLKKIIGCMVLCSFLSGQSSNGSISTTPKLSSIVQNYKSYQLMTPKAYEVDFYLSLLCRGAIAEDIETTNNKSGPHARSSINVYVNSIGVKALQTKRLPYPVGTVIVKEKNPRMIHYIDDTTEAERTASIGGMIKRKKGFDPDNGDWEYFYKTSKGALESGKMKRCIQCHKEASKQDFVYKNWFVFPKHKPENTLKR